MKKHITREQWEELDLNQVNKWFSDDKEKSATYPNIGDMIEFLEDEQNELCDDLWEEVKLKLNK